MRLLKLLFLVSCIATPALAEENDEAAFKARVAACKTTGCLGNVAYLYTFILEDIRVISQLQAGPIRARREHELAYARAQLHDPELYPMMEDGRWHAMTEAQKQDWALKRWGPRPD
jgi:hypothetical protein